MDKRPTEYCRVLPLIETRKKHLRKPFWVYRYVDSKEPGNLYQGWETPVRHNPATLKVVTHPANSTGIILLITEATL